MQKIKLIPHLFLEIMQQMDGTLDILGNLGIDSHIHQKEEKKKKQTKNKQTKKNTHFKENFDFYVHANNQLDP